LQKENYFSNRRKLFIILGASFLFFAIMTVYFTTIDCTWNENKIPELPSLPINSSLLSTGEILRRGNFRSVSSEYVIRDASYTDVIKFFEDNLHANCTLFSNNNSLIASCVGNSNNLGRYVVSIPPTNNQSVTTYTITLEWGKCTFDTIES
jgi:hypothetical protein